MRFWDASAVVPLLAVQTETGAMLDLLALDPEMAVWWGTRVECASALARLGREGHLDPIAHRDALRVLADLAARWVEVQPSERLRSDSEKLLLRHPLRAGDALQLAAASALMGPANGAVSFACLDDCLTVAAIREGFDVVP